MRKGPELLVNEERELFDQGVAGSSRLHLAFQPYGQSDSFEILTVAVNTYGMHELVYEYRKDAVSTVYVGDGGVDEDLNWLLRVGFRPALAENPTLRHATLVWETDGNLEILRYGAAAGLACLLKCRSKMIDSRFKPLFSGGEFKLFCHICKLFGV